MFVVAIAIPSARPEAPLSGLAPSSLVPTDLAVVSAIAINTLGESLDPYDHLRSEGKRRGVIGGGEGRVGCKMWEQERDGGVKQEDKKLSQR